MSLSFKSARSIGRATPLTQIPVKNKILVSYRDEIWTIKEFYLSRDKLSMTATLKNVETGGLMLGVRLDDVKCDLI